MIRSLILAFLLSISAFAQNPLYLDLSGEWRIMQGDQPDFARADFDDTRWPAIQLPRHQLPPFGFAWLRRQVELPSGTDTSQLALTLGMVAESYQIYCNGILVASVGGFQIGRTYVARPRSFTIPPNLATPHRKLTLALRLWRPPGFVSTRSRSMSLQYFPDRGPYLLTNRVNAPVEVDAATMWSRERMATEPLLVSEFEAVLALILLAAWLSQRERKEVPLLAAFLLSECWLLLYDYVSLVGDWPHVTNNTSGVCLTLSSLLLAYLAAVTLGHPLRWLKIAAWFLLSYHVAVNLEIAALGRVTGYLGMIPFRVYMRFVALTDLVIAAILLSYLGKITSGFRRLALTNWFAFSIMILALLKSQRGSGALQVVDLSITIAGSRWTLFDFGTVTVGFWMTLQLIRGLGAARQRLAGEMEAARVVQQFLLPRGATAWPGYETRAEYLPAQEVGGDFYQFMEHPDGSRIAILADVSGKGLKAAMLVSVAVGVLRRETSSAPAEILTALNRALFGHTGGGFVTCCCIRLEPDGRLIAASAGHPAAYLAGAEIAMHPGLPLGVLEQAEYCETHCVLPPGGQLAIVSDGVLEAVNGNGELFGFDRAREISGESAQAIAVAAKAWGQNDDITVVTVRRMT